jgi:hypothetical protein
MEVPSSSSSLNQIVASAHAINNTRDLPGCQCFGTEGVSKDVLPLSLLGEPICHESSITQLRRPEMGWVALLRSSKQRSYLTEESENVQRSVHVCVHQTHPPVYRVPRKNANVKFTFSTYGTNYNLVRHDIQQRYRPVWRKFLVKRRPSKLRPIKVMPLALQLPSPPAAFASVIQIAPKLSAHTNSCARVCETPDGRDIIIR